MKRFVFLKIILSLVFLLFFIQIAAAEQIYIPGTVFGGVISPGSGQLDNTNIQNMASYDANTPITVKLTQSKIPLVNEETILHVEINSIFDAPETNVKITLPPDVELIRGSLEKNIDLKANTPQSFDTIIKFTQPGNFKIIALAHKVIDLENSWGDMDVIYLTIGNVSSKISTYGPIMYADRAQSASEQGLNKSEISTTPQNLNIESQLAIIPNVTLFDSHIKSAEPNIIYPPQNITNSSIQGTGTLTVTGTWGYYTKVVGGQINDYRDTENTLVPLKRAMVAIYDNSTLTLLGYGISDDNGEFSINIANPYPNSVYVYVWACSPYTDPSGTSRELRVVAQGSTLSGLTDVWAVFIGPFPTTDGSHTQNIGSWAPTIGTDWEHAFMLFQDLIRAQDFLGGDVGSSTILWNPTNIDGAHYHFGSQIHLNGEDYKSADTSIHEFGHNYMWTKKGSWTNTCPSPHYIILGNNTQCGYTEGWPNFLSLAVNGNPTYTWASGATLNLETPTWGTPTWDNGDGCEGRVAGALWDMYDNVNDGYDTYQYTYSFNDATMRQNTGWTFSDFWNTWKSLGYSSDAIWSIYQNTIDYSPPLSDYSDFVAYGDAWKSYNSTHTVIMWNATGSHTWVSTGNASSVEYLVIGGGGAGHGNGAAGNSGGGGHAGQFKTATGFSVSGTIPVTIGTGGLGVANASGNPGGNSIFSAITSTGGLGSSAVAGYPGPAGGNGAGASGGAGSDQWGGVGGIGLTSSITGVSTYYAGGGGAGFTNGAAGGLGGGGHGQSYSGGTGTGGTAGMNGLGSGGGGVSSTGSHAGYAGGSGVVIIRYVTPVLIANFTANISSGKAPLPVSFTDLSTNTPTGWAWYFGDENWTVPAWTQINASAGWSPRYVQSSVIIPDGSIVLMGGFDSDFKNDVWRSTNNGTTWTQMNASAGWSPRGYHSSVVMPDGSIVLMGGGTYSIGTNDTWRSTDKGATWTRMTAHAEWSARLEHSSVVMPDDSIILMGGWDGQFKNDVWRSIDKGATWTQVIASAGWSGRNGLSSVAMPDGSIVLTGGQNSSGQINDVWRSTDKGATWTQMTANAGWLARSFSGLEVMPDGSIVLIGGTNGGNGPYYNDVWRSIDKGATWTQVTASAGWSGRSAHTSVLMPDGSLVLMGGSDYNYHPRNDVWRLMTAGSSAKNPSHTYTVQGLYNVSLRAYNTAGYNSTRKTGYITVSTSTVLPDKMGVFRPSNHMFYLKNGTITTSINWGISTDLPVTGDWNKDGRTDVGVFRPSNHMFYLKNGTTTAVNWGISTDLPVTGDWNGDGRTDVGVYRPSAHTFYLKNGTTTAINWGESTDLPVTGDWNKDGRTEVGVYRPSTHTFYLKNGTTTTSVNWGISTDLPVTGDWNGDGRTDVGVYRPSAHTFYLTNGTTTAINWGVSTDLPVTGKW